MEVIKIFQKGNMIQIVFWISIIFWSIVILLILIWFLIKGGVFFEVIRRN